MAIIIVIIVIMITKLSATTSILLCEEANRRHCGRVPPLQACIRCIPEQRVEWGWEEWAADGQFGGTECQALANHRSFNDNHIGIPWRNWTNPWWWWQDQTSIAHYLFLRSPVRFSERVGTKSIFAKLYWPCLLCTYCTYIYCFETVRRQLAISVCPFVLIENFHVSRPNFIPSTTTSPVQVEVRLHPVQSSNHRSIYLPLYSIALQSDEGFRRSVWPLYAAEDGCDWMTCWFALNLILLAHINCLPFSCCCCCSWVRPTMYGWPTVTPWAPGSGEARFVRDRHAPHIQYQ